MQSYGLSRSQLVMCHQNFDHMPIVSIGARIGILQCEEQFKFRHWNCTSGKEAFSIGTHTRHVKVVEVSPYSVNVNRAIIYRMALGFEMAEDNQKDHLRKDSASSRLSTIHEALAPTVCNYTLLVRLPALLNSWKHISPEPSRHGASAGTREAGFVHAIASAGVVHALARSCKEARLSTCGCSKAERPQQLHRDWIWGGCGDNIDYAYRFSKAFIDIREMEKSFPRNSLGLARKLMNLHNNRVGRLAVYRLATVACKCHGMSGSCSLRTCWTQLSPFPRVGQRLQERYESAIKVKFNRRGTQLRRANRHLRQITSDHLIYLEESPNFCAVNPLTGQMMTSGRECLLQGHSSERCSHLCCGRGHRTFTREVPERCYCQFHWCCSIECQTCIRKEEVHICN
ncbi:hypothetical protein Aperf_G00000024281 [Anoplocephala perfoliata]